MAAVISTRGKFHPVKRDILTGDVIHVMVGHEMYGDSDVVARVFGRSVPMYRGGPMEMHYYPQIDDEVAEDVIEIGPSDGYRFLGEAKRALLERLAEYLAERAKNPPKRW